MIPTSISKFFCRRLYNTATLRGHTGPVISMAFSPSGAFVASGGEYAVSATRADLNPRPGADGVKIWDLKTRNETEIPQQAYQERAQVSSVCWVTRRNETLDTLCYGNALGFMVFLQYRPTKVSL